MALDDNFEAYSTGDLNGQGGWSGDTNFDVQTSVVNSGSNAVTNGAASGSIAISITPDTAGLQRFYVRSDTIDSTNGIQLQFKDDGNSVFLLTVVQSAIDISGSTAEFAATGLSSDTWYEVDVQWDATRGTNGQVRARVDEGTWTSWVEAASSFTDIDEINVEGDPGPTYYLDDFSEETAPTTTTTSSSSTTTTSNTSTSSTTSSSSTTTTSATSTSSTTTSNTTSSSTTSTTTTGSSSTSTSTSNTSTSSTTSTSSSTTTGLPFMIPNLEINPSHT